MGSSFKGYRSPSIVYMAHFFQRGIKADFYTVEFSDWTGNPLFTCENAALNLNRMLRVANVLLCQIQSARKILLSGNQPLDAYG